MYRTISTLLLILTIFLYNCAIIDTIPPSISISSHTSGQKVGEKVIITVNTYDSKGISKVEFYIDNKIVFTDNDKPFAYGWNTTDFKDGSYRIKAKSYDPSDNSAESMPITLKVDNKYFAPTAINIASIKFDNGGYLINWEDKEKLVFDDDFQSCQIEWSNEVNMNNYSTIFITNDKDIVSFFDSNQNPISYNYYRINVTDTFGLETRGTISLAPIDPLPRAIEILTIESSLTEMTITWEKSIDNDFKHYILLNAKSENGHKTRVEIFTEKETTSYTTSEFDSTKENWFWILVEDVYGQYTIGDGKKNNL